MPAHDETRPHASTETLAVLLAHPAGHSLSPRMHDVAFRALGMRGRYEAWDVPPQDLPEALERVRAQAGLLGANVSVPHKLAVVELLDGLADDARTIGAVNTVVRREGGLFGHNTDVSGLAAALGELARPPEPGRAVVLGAGGAARAAVAVLLRFGCSVLVHNRGARRAEVLVEAASGAGDVRAVSAGELDSAVAEADWLVNTTPIGMQGGPAGSPLPAGVLPERGTVVDLIYRPRLTPLLAAAQAAGLPTQDGLAMLLHQGAAAFALWTGRDAPVAVMREALESALDEDLAR